MLQLQVITPCNGGASKNTCKGGIVAAEMGYNSFQVAPEIWQAMTKPEQVSMNMKFLADVVARADEVVFSKKVVAILGETDMFRKELDFLYDSGYRLTSDGLGMVKKF